jgi:hypothetical protein
VKKAAGKAKVADCPIDEKMALFDELPEQCGVCRKEFDKTDREMVSSWNVVVRESQGKVNLYCPPCWEKGKKMIIELQKRFSENPQSGSKK